nr:N-formylglutamate deformylase [Piscinibacter sakaiensis]
MAGPAEPIRTPHYTLWPGRSPLLVSVPHAGRHLPDALRARLQPRAAEVEDCDWFLDEVYGFARELGAGLLVPQAARYVIDLNRPPADTPMYAGRNNTGLVPTRFFSGEPLYLAGQEPGPDEVAQRRATWWQPYHDALRAELDRLKAVHGHALLWEGHSIRSELPWLFEGRLPDLNLGTVEGRSCTPALRAALARVLAAQDGYSHVVDGRFKGGHITRAYGQPAQGVQAVQLEMVWATYMAEAPPWRIDPARLARLQPVLRSLLGAMLAWRPDA